MSRMLRAALVVLAILFAPPGAHAGPDDVSEVVGILEIFRWHPPQDRVFIGVGSSPSFQTAMIRALDDRLVTNIPISGATYLDTGTDGWKKYRDKFWLLFDRFAPPVEVLRQKTLVLMDYAMTKKTLLHLEFLLKEWARERHGIELSIELRPSDITGTDSSGVWSEYGRFYYEYQPVPERVALPRYAELVAQKKQVWIAVFGAPARSPWLEEKLGSIPKPVREFVLERVARITQAACAGHYSRQSR